MNPPLLEYLIDIKLTPPAVVPTPAEAAAITERLVLPTLEALERLALAGRIVAGGPVLGSTALTFIARVESAHELDRLIVTLPLWPRAQTSVVPLGTFGERAATVRERLATLRTGIAAAASVPLETRNGGRA